MKDITIVPAKDWDSASAYDWSLLRTELETMAEPEYRDFSERLTPGCGSMLGVRIPRLRVLAARLAKGNWRAVLTSAEDGSFEEIMLQGLLLGYAKAPPQELLERLTAFVPKITNWAVCDVCCSSFHFVEKNRESVFEFLQPYFLSSGEFGRRFAVVMLMDYFLTNEYIGRVLEILEQTRHPGYYCKMAVAWALSVCFVKFPLETMELLKKSCQDTWTYNKALQKITESRRVDEKTKQLIRQMKRK